MKQTGAKAKTAATLGPVDLRIGLDFGTSASKIIVRPMYQAEQRAYVVPVADFAVSEGPYLWASQLWIDSQGNFTLKPQRHVVHIPDLKVALMRHQPPAESLVYRVGDASANPIEGATAYIALLLRQARAWFAFARGALFGTRALQWSANVGFPAESYDDAHLCLRYRRVLAAAWTLAQSAQAVTVANVCAVLDATALAAAAESRSTLQQLGIDLIPEVVAEAHGFAQSPVRADGLHFVVDAGAGTLDVCSFVLGRTQQGQDQYAILKAKVELLGAEIYKARAETDADRKRFIDAIERLLHRTIWRTKQKRYPTAPEWAGRLPFLFCGGGMAIAPYRDIPRLLEPWFGTYLPDCRPAVIPITAPDELILDDGQKQVDYRRLAVAFGLSYPGSDIGGIDLPSIIPNIPPPPRRDNESAFTPKEFT